MPPADSPLARFLPRIRARPGPTAPDPAPDPASRTGLVLHLGDFKTGTTAIQTWLGAHGPAAGIITPPGFNQARLAQSLSDPDEAVPDRAFAETARCLDATTAPHAVISAEHFEMADPARLATMIGRHLARWETDLRLIAYVRPHPAAYLARFAESTRIGSHDGDLGRYLDLPQLRRRMTYATRLGAWRAVFGDRLTVRLYDRTALAGGDVVRDFAGFVTGQDPGDVGRVTAANPTPGLADLALLRALHRAIGPLPPGMRQGAQFTLGRHLGRQLERRRKGYADQPLRLHRALAERLATVFGADAAAMDATFFADAGQPFARALSQAVATADTAPPPLLPEDHLTPEALAIIALWGEMLRDGIAAEETAALMDRIYHE
jgi:hypothetical protein